MVVATAMMYLQPGYCYMFQLRKLCLGDYCCLGVEVQWILRATLLLIKKCHGRIRYVQHISHKSVDDPYVQTELPPIKTWRFDGLIYI